MEFRRPLKRAEELRRRGVAVRQVAVRAVVVADAAGDKASIPPRAVEQRLNLREEVDAVLEHSVVLRGARVARFAPEHAVGRRQRQHLCAKISLRPAGKSDARLSDILALTFPICQKSYFDCIMKKGVVMKRCI